MGIIFIWSVAHILNLVVKNGIKMIKEWIKRIRDSVAYWMSTSKWVETFEMATRQLQVKCVKKLAFDCVAGWNSTHVILDVAMKYKKMSFLDCSCATNITLLCQQIRNGRWLKRCWKMCYCVTRWQSYFQIYNLPHLIIFSQRYVKWGLSKIDMNFLI